MNDDPNQPQFKRALSGQLRKVKPVNRIIRGARAGSGVFYFGELVERLKQYYYQVRNPELRSYSEVRDKKVKMKDITANAGVGKERIRHCLSGRSEFKPSEMDALLRALGITVMDLIQDCEILEVPSLLTDTDKLSRVRVYADKLDEEIAALSSAIQTYTTQPATHRLLVRTGTLVGLLDDLRSILQKKQ